jgi:hypothetical protein
MTLGAFGVKPLASLGAASQPSQVRLGTGLVQEDQPGGIPARLLPPPRAPRARDIWSVLLTGSERLFLYVSPIFSSA